MKAAGCTERSIYREKVSGARSNRDQLARLLDKLAAGDVLKVTRLDRLARSTRDLLNVLDTISKRGAFQSLGDQWADTTTAHGRLMVTVLGGLAEFERELIVARTSEGRERARARGVHLGRKPTLTPHQQREVQADLAAGRATRADLARRFNVDPSTISRVVARVARASRAPRSAAATM